MVHLISKPKSDTNFFVYSTSNDITPQYIDMLARLPQYLVLFWPIGRVKIAQCQWAALDGVNEARA